MAEERRRGGLRTAFCCALLLIGLLALPRAQAAIAVDNSATTTGSGGTLSWSHTVNSSSSTILIVGISIRGTTPSITSVTYGASSLTFIAQVDSGGNQNRTAMYYLLAPATGPHTITVNYSGSGNAAAGSVSYTGVNQSTPLGTAVTVGSNGSGTASVTVASAAGQLVVDTVTANGDANTLTAGGSQTQIWSNGTGTSGGDVRSGGSTQPGAASVTMSWTLGTSKPWTIVAVPLLALAGVTVSGTVYNDANHNSALDAGETGTGVTGLYVKLATYSAGACQSPATSANAVTPATGAYSINGVTPGTYCLILDNNTTLTDLTSSVPAGWIGTQNASGIIQVTTTSTGQPPPQNFGLYNGGSVSGTVFADTGVGSGTANNGVKDGTEAGISGVTVQTSGATSTSATTASNGTYTLWIPSSASGTLTITPVLPSNYLATGGSAGTTGGTYTRPSVSFTPAAGGIYTGVNFGMVPPNSLTPNSVAQAEPAGGTAVFAHTFLAGSGGQVTFSIAATATPATPTWSQILYQDTACTGALASGDPVITAAITVTANQKICLLVKVQVPAGATGGAEDVITLSAAFSYTNASPALNATVTASDAASVNTFGALALSKLVSDVTLSTGPATSVNANPGDTLQYALTATNNGSQSVSTLVIYDSTPSFTTFVSTSCPALPAGMTGCTVTTQPAPGASGALQWTFTGSLTPGATLTVTYRVQVGS